MEERFLPLNQESNLSTLHRERYSNCKSTKACKTSTNYIHSSLTSSTTKIKEMMMVINCVKVLNFNKCSQNQSYQVGLVSRQKVKTQTNRPLSIRNSIRQLGIGTISGVEKKTQRDSHMAESFRFTMG